MKRYRFLVILSSVLFACPPAANSQSGEHGQSPEFPCRVSDSPGRPLFVMTLGDVRTALAQGVYDAEKDEVRLGDGRIIAHWYRDSLGVRFFAAIDKSRFPVPPSGWCSWYYYYQEVNEEEIRRNAEWIAENLKDYGARIVQIDDGWQGTGRGLGENRDWSTVNKRFPHGMDGLASAIKALGLVPGLWLAPHGQSNPDVVRDSPGAFLLKPDGTSASDTWEGKFLVNPSTGEGQAYLAGLFQTLRDWGYGYFKIDGQPIVVDEYRKLRPLFKDPAADPLELYRKTIGTVRSAIGRDSYLLGCWGIPLEGAGIMNGARTGGDVLLGWGGFMAAVDATMKSYYLHNVAWYCDPDVMLLRSPLTVDQARAWASLQGLTGQALMASDRMTDLSDDRVELLKRVFPAVDIRPLDLFPSGGNKRIWDLKVNHLGRQYDVVGLFNFSESKTDQVYAGWSELGITDTGAVHVYDFWNKEYLGCWKGGISLPLPSTSCRVLTLVPASGQVELISTSRHITQGWVDLVSAERNPGGTTWHGRSRLVKGDPYELRFAFPRGTNMAVRRATAGSLPVTIAGHQGWAAVQFTSPATEEVAWSVEFGPSADYYSYPVRTPRDLGWSADGLDRAKLRWSSQYYLTEGYQVYVNGTLAGYTPANSFTLRDIDPHQPYTVQVSSVWQDGTESEERAEARIRLADQLPDEVYLSDLEPGRATIGWGTIEMDRAVTGRPLSVGGKQYRKGIGTHANSDIEYSLYGMFDTLTARVGIDEGNNSEKGTVDFSVVADGRKIWDGGVLKRSAAAASLELDIKGVQRLVLRASDGGDGNEYDHADWIEAKVRRSPP